MSIKRQTLWNLAPQLATAALGFFSLPWIYKYLGTEMFAIQGYINSVATAFGFADLGLGVAVGRFISVALGKNDRDAVRGYWGTANLIVLPALLLVTLGFIGLTVWCGPKWFNVPPTESGLLQACFVVNGLGLFFSYYGSYWLSLSQAHLDFKFIGLIRVIMTLLQILPQMALAYFTHNVLWLLVWASSINVLQLVVLIWHARRHYSMGFCLGTASLARAREMAGFTSKMFLNLIVGAIFSSMDLRILGRLASPDQFSPYNFTNNVTQRLQSLSVSVMGPIFHNTARVADETQAAAAIYNNMFAFMFDWYLLAAIWLGLWHPVLLFLYVGSKTALLVGPLLGPLIAAASLTSIANISSAQLGSLNRMGVAVGFAAAAGSLAAVGVWTGYAMAGVKGAAYGYLFSRLALIAQDLYTIRLIKAGGWLDHRTWLKVAAQGLAAGIFALAYTVFPATSCWLVIPAALHGGLVALWLLREPLRKFLTTARRA